MTDLKPVKYIELKMDLVPNTPLSHTRAEKQNRENFKRTNLTLTKQKKTVHISMEILSCCVVVRLSHRMSHRDIANRKVTCHRLGYCFASVVPLSVQSNLSSSRMFM